MKTAILQWYFTILKHNILYNIYNIKQIEIRMPLQNCAKHSF